MHYHVGKDVVFPSKRVAVSTAKDTLDAKIEQATAGRGGTSLRHEATVMVRLQW